MNERLKELAEHAGFTKTFARSWLWLAEDEELEHFAELIRQDELEVCAKLAEITCCKCTETAESIRERGEK